MISIQLFVLGLFIGSFLNMLIDRIPRGEQVISGRSHCDSCNHVLTWRDLMPVLGWVFLKGKCRYCRKPIPIRNTIVELVTGVLFVCTFAFTGPYNLYLFTDIGILLTNLAIISALIAICMIDLDHMIIPDSLLLVMLVAFILQYALSPISIDLASSIYTGLAAGGFFLSLVLITKGRGMGLGDVKYALVAGVILGFPYTLYALYVAFLTGAFISVILILNRKKRLGQTIPFGPFLVVGTILAHLHLLTPIGSKVFPF